MKAQDPIKTYQNPDGPIITTVETPVIEQDGLYFKDIDGSGELKIFDDWRKSPKERAEALVEVMSPEEKIGQLFVTSRPMGIDQKDKEFVDETGLLDEKKMDNVTIFAGYDIPGTTKSLLSDHGRNYILRANPKPADLTKWLNQLQVVAEKDDKFIPVLVTTNSRNENGKVVFGMNDAVGVFPAWPGTLGIAAATLGTDLSVIDKFGQAIRKEWDAAGLKKGYMYMADVVTDPRWQRIYGTFGENPELITEIVEHLVPAIQGSKEGITRDGVALTMKHWPGGGARENGFDPHYKEGQWNVYATEDSLRKYHLKGFEPAIELQAASIMPYYAKPNEAKSAPQYDKNGNPMEWIPLGFAFNKYFIDTLLRDQYGYKGYINSDSGIIDKMGWGVENLDRAERIALAVNTGVDLISESYGFPYAKEAMERARNGYYDTHPIPEGYTIEDITLSEEALNRAVARTLEEKFALGMFENPYRSPEEAEAIITNGPDWETAWQAHLQSVVVLKNKDSILPYNPANRKFYVQYFDQTQEASEKWTAEMKELLKKMDIAVAETVEEADDALLMVSANSGNYFSATKGLLEIDLCENKEVADFSEEGLPLKTTHTETTVYGISKVPEIAKAIHEKGGKVLGTVNITLPWMLGNLEPYCDALLAGFDTKEQALLDVMFGKASPFGKLPMTLPRNDAVIAVNAEGICISPNDVPGYDKDQYIPDELKDENGKAYAYRDSEGNYYEYGYGLRW